MNMEWGVLSPLGEAVVKETPLASRPETLEGKTVCEIWNGAYIGEVTFPMIEEMLRKRYPNVNIIPYSELPFSTVDSMKPATKTERLESIKRAFLEKGCDAVITGNGG